jgi:hypothetical protein
VGVEVFGLPQVGLFCVACWDVAAAVFFHTSAWVGLIVRVEACRKRQQTHKHQNQQKTKNEPFLIY